MKALVFSDSHGSTQKMFNAITLHSDIDTIFFLGDGLRDIEKLEKIFPNKKYIKVCGNCDFYPLEKDVAYKYIDGNTIVAAHGHKFDVKLTLSHLAEHVKSVLGNTALYGHTHTPEFHYDENKDIYFLNPGSIGIGSYAIAEFTKNEVTASLLHI